MPKIPDFSDLRFLNEVGWFLYREKYGYNHWTASYDSERIKWSTMLLEEFLRCSQRDEMWVRDKVVVSIGAGCTGDLAAWPAALKVVVEPLSYTYQKLKMLIEDVPGTTRTVYLSVGVEGMPLLDDFADLVICRNALDHMPDPGEALEEIWRILKPEGTFFLSVDIGGDPTPDEPSPFTLASLSAMLAQRFEVSFQSQEQPPFNAAREYSLRIVARKKAGPLVSLNKEEILQAYEVSIRRDEGAST